MKVELNIIREILFNPSGYNITTPIAHLVTKDPDFNAYSDTCLEVACTQVPALKFWYYVEWTDTIKSLALKKLCVSQRCPLTNKLICINLLDLLQKLLLML